MDEFVPEVFKKGMISPIDLEKFEYILNQQKKYCCKIYSKNENIGTGFFCKIILPNSLSILPVLMTCNHVLDEDDIKIAQSINFSLDNEKHKYTIRLDNKRLVYTNSNMDFTIIQLRKSDNLDIDSFLSIDEEIIKEKSNDNLNELSIYLLHYQNGERAKISFGTIIGFSEDKIDILHNCGSEKGSSGGPLINNTNFKLIGIHKGYKNKNNRGTFIKPIIEDFFSNVDLKNINFQDDFENNININNELKDAIEQKEKIIDNNVIIKTNEKDINNSIYYLVLLIGIIKEFSKSYVIYYFHMNPYILIILFFVDILCGIILNILLFFCNESNKFLLIVSLFLLIIPYFPLKIINSSFYKIIPFVDNKFIQYLIIGESIGNIFGIVFTYDILDYIYATFFFLYILIIISTILIIKNFYKLDQLMKKDELYIKKKFDYFEKNIILNFILYFNYSISFSTTFILLIMKTNKKNMYIFILSDILGRFLGSKMNENFFKPLLFISCLYFFFLWIAFESFEFLTFQTILYLGLLSGSLTTIGYYIPANKNNKEEKISLLYYLRKGKYYIIRKLFENDKNKSD